MKKITPEMLLEAADRLEEAIAMPTVIRNAAKQDWGFYSDEEQRMHLQTLKPLGEPYKVWLDSKGTRVFQAATPVPSKVMKELGVKLKTVERNVEGLWVAYCINLDRIRFRLSAPYVVFTMYPGTHQEFDRRINLVDYYGEAAYRLTDDDVRFDTLHAAFAVGDHHDEDNWTLIELSKVMFTGSRWAS